MTPTPDKTAGNFPTEIPASSTDGVNKTPPGILGKIRRKVGKKVTLLVAGATLAGTVFTLQTIL